MREVHAPLHRGLRVGLRQPAKSIIAHERHISRERVRRLRLERRGDCGRDGRRDEPRAHQTLGTGAGVGSTAKVSTTTLPPSEPPVPAALPRSDPK